MAELRIGDRGIGSGHGVYIVAELSANHNGSLERALETVAAAAASGANAIKLQTYTPDTMTIDSSQPDFVVNGGPWAGRRLYDLYREAHTPWEWHTPLFDAARRAGLDCFSTPFDSTSVDFLEALGVPAYKVASFELIDDALLRLIASTGRPVIISTGMASLEDIAHALNVLRSSGAENIVVLHCTSAYPAPDESMNLSTIPLLRKITGCPVGLSDHTLGTVAAVAAVAFGAVMIEKHLTLSRVAGGVDSAFSLEPAEFAEMSRSIRRAEAMVGKPGVGPGVAEGGSMAFRRSLYVVEDIAAGETFTPSNLRAIRPGFGLSPRFLDVFEGRTAATAIRKGTPLRWEHLGG